MKKKIKLVAVSASCIALWSFLSGCFFGSLEPRDEYFGLLGMSCLTLVWMIGLAWLCWQSLRQFQRQNIHAQIADILGSQALVGVKPGPLYVYECPACGNRFPRAGLCPRDYIQLQEWDPIEDRITEDL